MSFLLILIILLTFARLFKAFGNVKYSSTFYQNQPTIKDIKVEVNNDEHAKFLQLYPEYQRADYIAEFEKLFDDILFAFAASHYIFLKQHVNDKVYEAFSAQIETRQNAGLRQELQIKHLATNIIKVIDNSSIVVEFDVSQMSAMFNYDNISEDNPHKVFIRVIHEWTMQRNENKNWILTRTKTKEV